MLWALAGLAELMCPLGSLTVLTVPCSSRRRCIMAPDGSDVEKLGGRPVMCFEDELEKNNGETPLDRGKSSRVRGGASLGRLRLPGGRRRGFLAAGVTKASSRWPSSTGRFVRRAFRLGSAKPWLSGGFQGCAGLRKGGAAKEKDAEWRPLTEAAASKPD